MDDTVEVNGEVKATTERAVLLDVGDGDRVWLPRSQIEEGIDDVEVGEDLTVTIPEWLANQEGL